MSTQVAATKLSFPFSCTASLSRLEKEHNQAGRIQVKALSVSDSKQNQPVVKQKHHEIIQVGPGLDLEEVAMCSEPEKLTADGEDQRPSAKRQLSSESAAKTVSVVKKSAVRTNAEDQPKLCTGLGLGVWPCKAPAAGKSRRRRDLFTDTEVFRKVDLHVLQAGAQVRNG